MIHMLLMRITNGKLQVAADWHELMLPHRPSTSRVNEQNDRRRSMQAYHHSNQLD